MNSRPRFHDSGDEVEDTNHDRTLRALEGRGNDDALRSAPLASSRRGAFDNEDTGDVFLKIAREETSQRQTDEQSQEDTRSVVVSSLLLSHLTVSLAIFYDAGYALCMVHGHSGCAELFLYPPRTQLLASGDITRL